MGSDNRPSGTDRFYRYVGIKAFDRYKDQAEIRRHRDLHLLRGLKKRIADLEATIADLLVLPSSEEEE